MKILKFFVIVFILSFLIFLHEFGHFYEMEKCGIPIEKFSIGMSLGVFPSYSFKIAQFPGTTIEISPFLMGGYVTPDKKKLSELNYYEDAVVSAAGVKVNLLFGLILILILIKKIRLDKKLKIILLTLSIAGLSSILFCRIFSGILIPIVGWCLFAHLVENKFKDLVGPIGVFKIAISKLNGFSDVVRLTALISIGLALANALPILPLDGGHIFQKILAEHFSESIAQTYAMGSTIFMIYIFIKVVIQDLKR